MYIFLHNSSYGLLGFAGSALHFGTISVSDFWIDLWLDFECFLLDTSIRFEIVSKIVVSFLGVI